MKIANLARLKFLALLFLLPGLGGLVASAVISTRYLNSLPRAAAVEQMRTVPRNIHGTVIYQTEQEDRRLSLIEDSSVGVFLLGLLVGLIYLERWGSTRHAELDAEEDDVPIPNSK